MKLDVLSSYVLRGFSILLRFFLIPIYISHLGLGAYGLIGFYFTIQAAMVFFDLGMGVASNKLLAEESDVLSDKVKRTIKSVELIYVSCAIALGTLIILFANTIADNWLNVNDPSINGTVIVRLMGALFIVSWPKSLYQSFLIGQKKMILQNKLQISVLLIQNLLLFVVITRISSTLEAYFYILIALALIENYALRYFGTKAVKIKQYANRKELKKFFKYSSGVGFLSVLSLIAFQFDRLYVSKSFSIEDLGLYNLAAVIPFVMLTIIYPITSAAFPRIVKIRESKKAQQLFIEWSTLLFLITSTILGITLFNLTEIFHIWLDKKDDQLIHLSTYIMLGVFLHTGTNMITNVLLANGRSRLVSTIFFISIVVYLTSYFIMENGELLTMAKAWSIFNACLMVLMMVSLFFFNKSLALKYFLRWITILIFYGGLSFALYHVTKSDFFDRQYYYKLGFYILALGGTLVTLAFYMFKQKRFN